MEEKRSFLFRIKVKKLKPGKGTGSGNRGRQDPDNHHIFTWFKKKSPLHAEEGFSFFIRVASWTQKIRSKGADFRSAVIRSESF